MSQFRFGIVLLSCVLCSACAYKAGMQNPEMDLPQWQAEQNAMPQQDWWRVYGSEELNQLFAELESGNFDMQTARARVQKAKALLGQQRADNWPTLDASLSARNSRDFADDSSSDSNSLSFDAAYEVDLWGSRSAGNYSARMSVIAEQQQYRSLRLQLQASLALAYFDYLALRERHTLAAQNLQASEELLELIQLRFEQGSASGIELNQQRNTWLATRASTLSIERAMISSERTLAVILGRENFDMPELQTHFNALSVPEVSPLQSAALLEYRPDVRIAEAQLRISEADLFQERKKRWPSLRLGAGMAVDEVLSGESDWVGSLLGSVSMPIFNAGKIRNQIRAADTDLSMAQINYRQVVIQAMQETLETLSEVSYQQELLQVREQEMANNLDLYELAKLRYDSGDTDFLNLLTAQRSWFSSRDSLLQARSSQLAATVNLFKAMGVAPEQAGDTEKPDL